MVSSSTIDRVLQTATELGDVPGVVAMAATADGVIYQGAFGRRVLPDGGGDRGHHVLDRFDDQGRDIDGSDAARLNFLESARIDV